MIVRPAGLSLFSYLCCNTNKTLRSMLSDTYHVHEAVFSTLAGDIVCLPLPVTNTTTLSYTIQHCVCVCEPCLCAAESSYDCAYVRETFKVHLHMCIPVVEDY